MDFVIFSGNEVKIMMCPKCQNRDLKTIVLKSGQKGKACDMCLNFWFEDENIEEKSGHLLSGYSQEEDIGFGVSEYDLKYWEHESLPKEKSKYEEDF